MNDMTMRARVLAALDAQEVLPVPVDVFSNEILPGLEAGLLEHFGLPPDDYDGLLRALGAHLAWCRPLYIGPPLETLEAEGIYTGGFPRLMRNIWGTWDGLGSYDYVELGRPLARLDSLGQVAAYPWPDPDWFDYQRVGGRQEVIQERRQGTTSQFMSVTQWAKKWPDRARVAGGWNPVFSRIMDLCGMEEGLVLMASRPDLVHALVTRIGDFIAEYSRRLAQATQGQVDILAFGDDFAAQDRMLIHPDRWREYFLPTWRRLFDIAHEHGMRAQLHMCGAVRPVLGDLIDAGLDIFETAQFTTAGMDAAELKREFGRHLTFYGGLDAQHLLPMARPDEVRAEVRRMVDLLGRNGRYILTTTHSMTDDVPVQNVIAMYDEALRYAPVD